MITGKQVAIMKDALGSTLEMKAGDKVVSGIWNDIQLTGKGLINGIYVGEKLYSLNEIDYIIIK